jgi:hypothetical protein
MRADAFLTDLVGAGIRLRRDGGDLTADVLPGANLSPYRERIRENKAALVAELLKTEIITALDVEPASFDRRHYESLVARLSNQEREIA